MSTNDSEHYFFMNMGRTFDSDVCNERYADFYGPAYYCRELSSDKMGVTASNCRSVPPTEDFLKDWLVRICELIDKYKPKVVDGQPVEVPGVRNRFTYEMAK